MSCPSPASGRKARGPLAFVRSPLAGCVLPAFLALVACEDLEDFRTGAGEVFRGPVVGSEQEDGGADRAATRLLYGFDTVTQMELTFDPKVAGDARAEASPGRVDTYVCADRRLEPCAVDERESGPISNAPLLPIRGLAEDLLSQYDFPGSSRVRNYLFHAPVTRAGEPGFATVFVSLMESGRVEVRVIAPPGASSEEVGPMFGIFRLGRARK